MGSALFYHLTRSSADTLLPTLIDKARAAGWRVEVRGGNAARLDALDTSLWLREGFLPHGRAGGPHDVRQPVLLTTVLDNPNEAEALFLIDGAEPGDLTPHERCIVLFDGRDEAALAQARGRWKTFKSEGRPVSYWKQGAERGWEKQA